MSRSDKPKTGRPEKEKAEVLAKRAALLMRALAPLLGLADGRPPTAVGRELDRRYRLASRRYEQRVRRMLDGVRPTPEELDELLDATVSKDSMDRVRRWFLDGGEVPQIDPANPSDMRDPRRAEPMGESTPWRGTAAVPMIVDPEAAIESAKADLAGLHDPAAVRAVKKLDAAVSLLQAFKKARNAGLAGILVAGAIVTSGCASGSSRNSPQFPRDNNVLRIDETEEWRRRHSTRRTARRTGTYAAQ